MSLGPLFSKAEERQPLRPYQERAIASVLDHMRGGAQSVCLVAPTGSGKTRMGEELVHLAMRKSGRVLWLAHRRELLKQASLRLRRSLGHLEVGVISPGEDWSPGSPVQVATVQTLLARDHRPEATLIVFDEAHHYVSDEWRALAQAYPNARAVGLTATPERGDGRPLGDVFQKLTVAASYSELIADGHLVPARVFEPGEYISDGLALDVVNAYQHYASMHRAFVFCRSVEEAHELALRFRRYGWPAAAIEANTPTAERDRHLADFAAGVLRVLVSVNTLTEGVDIPETSCIILARTIGHSSTYLQMVGRGLRPAPGKTECTVLDLVGAWRLHGLPTEDRDYSLSGEGGIRRKAATAVTQCLKCGAVSEAHVAECPMCGWQRPKRELAEQKIYETELREIAPSALAPITTEKREEVYAELRERQRGEGLALEWVVNEFKRRFGVRPDLKDVTLSERRAEYERLNEIARTAGRRKTWIEDRYKNIFGERPDQRSMLAGRIADRVAAAGG